MPCLFLSKTISPAPKNIIPKLKHKSIAQGGKLPHPISRSQKNKRKRNHPRKKYHPKSQTQKFRSSLFKGLQDPRTESLVALRRARNPYDKPSLMHIIAISPPRLPPLARWEKSSPLLHFVQISLIVMLMLSKPDSRSIRRFVSFRSTRYFP